MISRAEHIEEEKFPFSEVKEEENERTEEKSNGISNITNKSLLDNWNKDDRDSQIQISFLSKISNDPKPEARLMTT